MTTYRNTRLDHQRVELDGCHFIKCQLVECDVVFRGTEIPRLEETVFNQCQWIFEDGAGRTVAFLRYLYASFGEGGEAFRDMLFREASADPPGVAKPQD